MFSSWRVVCPRLATLAWRASRRLLSKTPGGTSFFQAPEVLSKEKGPSGKPLCFPEYATREISYQSDVYSLGVVMWCLIMHHYLGHFGAANMLTPEVVPNSKLRNLVNEMLQPDPAKCAVASKLLTTASSTPEVVAVYSQAPALASVTEQAATTASTAE